MKSLHMHVFSSSMILVSKRNLWLNANFTGFHTRVNSTWNCWYGSRGMQQHLEDFLLLFYLFSLAVKPSWLRFYVLIKCLFSLFLLLWWESGRRPADRSDRTPVGRRRRSALLFSTWSTRDKQTEEQIPELSDSLNRPQQRYLLHCFWTFSFMAQWKINMNRPEERKKTLFLIMFILHSVTGHNTQTQPLWFTL